MEYFKTAVELDPDVPHGAPVSGHGVHAAVYSGRRFAGEQADVATRRTISFMKVLEQDPKNTLAIAYLASLYLNEKDWANARAWYEKQIAVDPEQPGAATTALAFIAWSQWYPECRKARWNSG